jgi:hypothetical protein
MRARNIVVAVLVAVTTAGCTDECALEGQTAKDSLDNAAPGAVLTLALAGCSTCGHTKLTAIWNGSNLLDATGYVEIQLSPQCFVRDTTVMATPFERSGIADTNVKNCGAVVDYAAYVTNRTNVTLDYMDIHMTCPTLAE